jgi:hypothetical protein
MALDGQTPADSAGIGIETKDNWMTSFNLLWNQMKGAGRLLLSAAVVVLLAGSLFDLYEFNKQGATSSTSSIVSTFLTTGFVTGTSVDRASDTFFTGQCGP